MDTTPPSRRSEPRLPSKSASHLSQIDNFLDKDDPSYSLDLTSESTKGTPSSPPPQTTQLLPLKEFLLLSPSPHTRSKKARLIERPLEMADEPIDLVVPRRRNKGRASPMGLLVAASPRNNRRSRRRLDPEPREEKDLALGDENLNLKPRKRRQTGRSRRDKLSLVPSVPSSSSPKPCENEQSSLDHIMLLILDLIMWQDFTKSTLWFGFGSLCFLSSCFTNGIRWSVFSMISQLGLIFLAVSFFYNSFSKRNKDDPKPDFKLKEEDIVKLARMFLPATNLVIAKIREIFSGDPSTTLKVAPLLLFGAEYGHLITLRRLCAIGFFISFTVPRLYSCYSPLVNRQVEYWSSWVWEAWGACSHKKLVAVSAVTAFWNLSSIRTIIFAAFISAVILRYNWQKSEAAAVVEEGVNGEQRQLEQQAMVVVE